MSTLRSSPLDTERAHIAIISLAAAIAFTMAMGIAAIVQTVEPPPPVMPANCAIMLHTDPTDAFTDKDCR